MSKNKKPHLSAGLQVCYINHTGIKDIVPVFEYLNRETNEATTSALSFDGQIQRYSIASPHSYQKSGSLWK